MTSGESAPSRPADRAVEDGRVAPERTLLEEVLDQHAEIERLLGQIREADWPELGGLLGRLRGLAERHLQQEEEGGVLEIIGAGPGGAGAAARLEEEHQKIRAGLHGLEGHSPRDSDGARPGAMREIRALVDLMLEHEARESSLLHEAGAAENAPRSGAEAPRSRALAVNLRRTAVNVVVPGPQRVLLELTEHLHGVHEGTKALLHEVNHQYVGWLETLGELHRRAMGDFAYYLEQERAAEAIDVFCRLYEKALDESSPQALKEASLRRYLQYLVKLAAESGDRLSEIEASLTLAVNLLDQRFHQDAELAVAASPGLRRLMTALQASEAARGSDAARRCREVLAGVLALVQRRWLDRRDAEQWWREIAEAPPSALPPAAVKAISHAHLRSNLARIEVARDAPPDAAFSTLLEIPDASRMERRYLDAAPCVESPDQETWRNCVRQVRWLIRVLSEETLVGVHEEALAEIHRSCVNALREADARVVGPLVSEVFETLRSSGLSESPSALTLISRLGTEALSAQDPEWTEAFVEQLLDWDFAYPSFRGFSDEWAPRVNPAHVGAIRAFLSLIEADPEGTRSLVAGLVVHLTLGGVFLADTDLFQRDVSKLLRASLDPIYHPVKHLLRLLPVYFNEIGAEGELREVSSRIDEIEGRGDPLCHFLRKQCHVESNPELLGLIEATAHFWATGSRECLRPYVPPGLYDALEGDDPDYAGMRGVFSDLVQRTEPLEDLFALDQDAIEVRLVESAAGEEIDREKARLLFRLRELIGRKYEIHHDDVIERLRSFRHLPAEPVGELADALDREDLEAALDTALDLLGRLKDFILSDELGEANEQIYRKRHIAVGIPSLYGSYHEDKFEAVGLSFRLESLTSALFERMLAGADLHWMSRDALERVLGWLRLFRRALRIDGCRTRGLSSGIALLERAVAAESTDIEQFVNIFQALTRSVEQVIRIRFLDVYDYALDRILPRMLERGILESHEGETAEETRLKISERFLRDVIAKSFGLQQLDRLLGLALRSLMRARDSLEPEAAALLIRYDARHICVFIDAHPATQDGAFNLGNKGYQLRRLAGYGLPIPHGFILSTEIFRCRAVILACPELAASVRDTVRQQVRRIERLTGCGFGEPSNPLMLSVRSGTPVSMPGMLDTFLNVGMSEDIAEGFARRTGHAWAAWDAYRRFLQFFGMALGVDRGLFDDLMRDAKQRRSVEKKAEFAPDQMRDLALAYRQLVSDHGISVPEDPFDQLIACVDLVLRSWDSEKARLYREEAQIAKTWGTAVAVQNMVYGNLHSKSGTGVVMTYHPHGRSGVVGLRGDFVVQSQGEDVVGGLVETFPIRADERAAPMSLERDFPRIYAALAGHAHLLVHDQAMFHQEIEFTFESADPADLFVLQTRDAVMASVTSMPAFVPGDSLDEARLATGIGAGGGALSGRVAHSAADLELLRRRHPDEPIILLRPDTVPDDVPLVLRSDGMVTALGGATSHAALVAQRLGRTCVVGCRQLDVHHREGRSRIAGHLFETGDFISINGTDGSIYVGRHPTTMVRRERLL